MISQNNSPMFLISAVVPGCVCDPHVRFCGSFYGRNKKMYFIYGKTTVIMQRLIEEMYELSGATRRNNLCDSSYDRQHFLSMCE